MTNKASTDSPTDDEWVERIHATRDESRGASERTNNWLHSSRGTVVMYRKSVAVKVLTDLGD